MKKDFYSIGKKIIEEILYGKIFIIAFIVGVIIGGVLEYLKLTS